MTDPASQRRFTVAGRAARLDRYLAQHGDLGRGRRGLAALIAEGAVRVNGAVARKSTLVRAGDVITLRTAKPAHADACDVALSLLHVSDDVVAVDKPPGLPTTIGPSAGASLAGALRVRFPEMAGIDPRHAGLAHRLDTGTSGVLLAGRTREAYGRLRAAFRTKRVEKEYLAVVVGRLDASRTVDKALARHPKSRRRMVVARHDARAWPAETEVTPIGGDDAFTVVRLRMRTGVTHQLRVHLAAIGHPIVGDRRYGAGKADAATLGIAPPAWHFLHAHRIDVDDGIVSRPITTPFPEHWRPLFAVRGWSTPE